MNVKMKRRHGWKGTDKKCQIAHAYVVAGKMTVTEAVKKARVHHNTYERWLMTRNSRRLIHAVLRSNMSPTMKMEAIKRLGVQRYFKGENG